jgi:CRP-like cAMP-binding protein
MVSATGSKTTPLAALNDTQRRELHAASQPLEYCRGDTIFAKGEMGDDMFFIESGEVSLEFDPLKPAKTLSRGHFFGELALLAGGQLRTA